MIIPAADLSEQISTAGMEASGTGNMKLALNGALTIGTLDGANIEIRDHVGAENIAIFGMEAMDVVVRRKQGLDATDVIRRSPRLSRAINAIGSGEFSPGDPSRFESIAHALRHLDHYMVSADFDSYYEAQRGIDARWQVVPAWTRASHPQRGADGRGSPPTAPSANMPRKSGTCRCAGPPPARRSRACSAGRRAEGANNPYLPRH